MLSHNTKYGNGENSQPFNGSLLGKPNSHNSSASPIAELAKTPQLLLLPKLSKSKYV